MTEDTRARTVFREIEAQNPAVARAFRTFRARSRLVESREAEMAFQTDIQRCGLDVVMSPLPMASGRSLWTIMAASFLLAVGVVALGIVFGPRVLQFFVYNWQSIVLPISGLCLGAGIVLLVSRVGISSPLDRVESPDGNADEPLVELRNLAYRMASRLRSAYHLQLLSVLVVGLVFVVLIVWSMIMVSQERLLYASAFGSGGLAMVILAQWKWQPFDRINQARRLADNADTLATALRLRMNTISEIADPAQRAKAQWEAVSEYLDRS